MVEKNQIVNFIKSLPNLFKRYLSHIVFLVFVTQLLISLNALPYFNIIGKYYYYVTAFIWILLNILFKNLITNRRILILGILMFVFAIPFVLLDLTSVADAIGFLAYLLLFTYIVREVFVQRDDLKNG